MRDDHHRELRRHGNTLIGYSFRIPANVHRSEAAKMERLSRSRTKLVRPDDQSSPSEGEP